MDRKFHTDDFERFLKEISDEFKMYPSKRIWNSIYNNIHPQRKWPSVGMSIFLIFTLIILGHLNTTKPVFDSRLASIQPVYSNANSTLANPIIFSSKFIVKSIVDKQTNTINGNDLGSNQLINSNKVNSNLTIRRQRNIFTNKHLSNKVIERNILNNHQAIAQIQSSPSNEHPNLNKEVQSLSYPTKNSIESIAEKNSTETGLEQLSSITTSEKSNFVDLINSISKNEISSRNVNNNIGQNLQNEINILKQKGLSQNNQKLISAKDKEWIENYALQNRKATKKWAGKLTSMAYVTPSIVYRSLSYNPNYFINTNSNSPASLRSANQALKEEVNQMPSMGLEIGTGLQYSIFKNLSIKAGLQLNFARYSIKAFANSHPFSTTITLHDFKSNTNYEVYETTPYSNKAGLEAIKLHNESFQFSLPIGADLKLAGNENVQWNVGSTIQPTFVIGGKNYLISSDKRNFVKEPSLLRRWNLNAGFETFITFKSNGLTWQIGPQFRTQLFSTNSKKYVIEERLLNYGFKVGISKLIK
jgi:hypothetical protein